MRASRRKGSSKWGSSRWGSGKQRKRWKAGDVAAGTLGALLLLVAACAPPTVFNVNTPIPVDEAHGCVMEGVVDYGFRIVDVRRDDGIIKAERPHEFLGFISDDTWDVLEVTMFEHNQGSTLIQYTAGTVELSPGGPEFRGPSDEVEAIANEIADRCSQ